MLGQNSGAASATVNAVGTGSINVGVANMPAHSHTATFTASATTGADDELHHRAERHVSATAVTAVARVAARASILLAQFASRKTLQISHGPQFKKAAQRCRKRRLHDR